MTEPLIVVEGTLRLPSLHPLTDPLLRFGREWSSGRMRPPRSNSEISLFAARLETAYTAAVSLADRGAPYRPMSLWSVIPNARMRQSMLRLMQGQEPDDRPAPVAAPVAEPIQPIPLTVQTFGPARANQNHAPWLSKPLKTALAIAGVALVLWLLFSHDTHLPEDVAPAVANKTHDAATPASAAAASPAPTPTPVAKNTIPAPDRPDTRITPIAPIAPTAAVAVAANPTPRPVASVTPAHKQAAAQATRVKRPSPVATNSHASNGRKAAKKHAKPPTKYAKSPATYSDYTAYRAPSARSADYEPRAVYAPRAVVPVTRAATRPARAMTTQSLYDMLQHSPTLDNNFDAGVTGGETRRVSAQ
jgi:hypothetical protein